MKDRMLQSPNDKYGVEERQGEEKIKKKNKKDF